MEGFVTGVSVVVICALLCWLSYRSFRSENYSLALGLLILTGLVLRIYVGTDFFLHAWDERYHALVAKNMIGHPLIPTLYENPVLPYEFQNWTGNHIWLHKQPVPLWGISTSLFAFGANEIAVRIPSILLTTTGIYLAYSFGRTLFNRKVAYYTAFFYAINGLIIEMTSGRIATDHIDVFFLFFVQLAVLFALKFSVTKRHGFNLLCGLALGLAILSKWLPALIVLPIWGALLLESGNFKRKQILLSATSLCAVVLVVVLPWQLYIYTAFPVEATWESSFNLKHFFEVLEGQTGPFYYHFDVMRMAYGELIYIPLVWIIYRAIKERNNWKYWALLIWILVPFLFFSFASTKMQGYTLFTAPALFIITALFINELQIQLKNKKYKWVINLLIALMFILPIRYSIERVKPFTAQLRNPEWRNNLIKFSKETKDMDGLVVFNSQHPIECMFYSNATAYSHIPDKSTIDSLTNVGYAIYISDSNDVIKSYRLPNYSN